jgi:GT2 family glycosyltransferase
MPHARPARSVADLRCFRGLLAQIREQGPVMEDQGTTADRCEPTVGVVVVNYNGGERILRVLGALQRQRFPLAEVVVVDNASSDGSPARIRRDFPGTRIVALADNEGLSVARNVGLHELGTTLALLLDHDVYVEKDCVEKLVRAWQREHPTVVVPRVRLLPESDVVQADGAALHFLGTMILRNGHQPVDHVPALAGLVNGCIGACMLLDRQRVILAGGFDELFFFYFEDLEFSMRLRERGHRFWFEPSALVYHERAEGTPDLSFRGRGRYPPRRAYFTMRNRLLSMLIHYRLRTLLLLSPVLSLYELASFFVACKKGWPAQWWRAWSWQLSHLPTIVARRRQMQRLRRVEDRELLVGGPPPLAPAFLESPTDVKLHAWFSRLVNGYWDHARNWIH